MRKIFLSFLIVLLLFSSCSSDNPAPSGEDVNPPAAADESTLVQKTTEGKFIVETTLQSLSDDIQTAIGNRDPEVNLSNVVLDNGVKVTTGKIVITAPDPAARAADSSYTFSVIIEDAITEDNEPVTLNYESNIQLDGKNITKIEPVKTEAEIGGAAVSDIDSDTFIPVALAFFNEDLLNSLSQMIEEIAKSSVFEKFGISLEQITINTNIESIGKVDVDCAKSALLSNGEGVLVFKLVDLDNQWHTAFSSGGVITIDGWADVKGGAIEISKNREVKDEDSGISAAEELDIVNNVVPRFYVLYYSAQGLIIDRNAPLKAVYEANLDQLKLISQAASYFFKDEVTVSSYKIELDDVMMAMMQEESTGIPSNVSRDNPGISEIHITMDGYGDIEMILHAYAISNSSTDNKIVSFKIGDKDYSYLSNDILKSILRVFSGILYTQQGADGILLRAGESGEDPGNGEFIYEFNNERPFTYSQLTIDGSVSINVSERREDGSASGDFSFENVHVLDEVGYVPYDLSGNGSFSTVFVTDKEYPDDPDFEVQIVLDSYSIKGVGVATEDDLEVINMVLSSGTGI